MENINKIIRTVICIQNFKDYGFSNSVYTDRGFAFKVSDEDDWYENRRIIKKAFLDSLNIELGKNSYVLQPNTYGSLVEELKVVLLKLLKDSKKTPNERYDEVREIFEKHYVINIRKPNGILIDYIISYYKFFKKAFEKHYPLYITPVSEKDIQTHYGTYKFGNKLEEW